MLDICSVSTHDVTINTAYKFRMMRLHRCALRAPELAEKRVETCVHTERKMIFLIRWRRLGNQAISIQLVYFELNRMLFRFLWPTSRVAHIVDTTISNDAIYGIHAALGASQWL